ncbi:MAG TPA: hypothetical protein VFR20_00280, partial [Burkholderiaceae bacterium]|nr:hypothetical protein [Burkholderiaceae bacterium]
FDTWDVLRTYNDDWRLIIVGDATMSPYEILQVGGSVEHYNTEPGAAWLQRLLEAWPRSAWLNPEPQGSWHYRQSIALVKDMMHDHMYSVTVDGLEQAMRQLSK